MQMLLLQLLSLAQVEAEAKTLKLRLSHDWNLHWLCLSCCSLSISTVHSAKSERWNTASLCRRRLFSGSATSKGTKVHCRNWLLTLHNSRCRAIISLHTSKVKSKAHRGTTTRHAGDRCSKHVRGSICWRVIANEFSEAELAQIGSETRNERLLSLFDLATHRGNHGHISGLIERGNSLASLLRVDRMKPAPVSGPRVVAREKFTQFAERWLLRRLLLELITRLLWLGENAMEKQDAIEECLHLTIVDLGL